VVVKPKQRLTVGFDVTFACANDPARTTRTALHDDFRYTAQVDYAELAGTPDAVPANDACPRPPAPPSEGDPKPDDRGCGKRRPDGTLGGAVRTDIIVGP
jgi:hypothetical protein